MKSNTSASRLLFFVIVAALHAVALFAVAWGVHVSQVVEESPVAEVMKLMDVEEQRPPPVGATVAQNTVEAVAENLVETDVVPTVVLATGPVAAAVAAGGEEYIPQSRISVMPKFNEKDILSKLVYPPIAQRSGIAEGRVVLELFVNRQGLVTRINILKEEPAERGFGEAAVRAFTGAVAVPAEANGEVVAVRIRYPVRFQLKDTR